MELLEIAKLPTAENSAIHLNPLDNIAIARVPLSAGTKLRVDGVPIEVLDSIPAGHKIAVARIQPGEMIHRYGQNIGRAKQLIEPGKHVHTHNVSFEELTFEYQFPTGEAPRAAMPKNLP